MSVYFGQLDVNLYAPTVPNMVRTPLTLFGTKKGIEKFGKFLINTEIATRKWILGDLE